jgi:hypothetical protein
MRAQLLNAAIELADRGLSVFPLAPRTKIPRRGSRGLNDATRDIDQIHEWWTTDSQANIGVRTVELAVVDLDLYQPKSGESWDRLLNSVHPESFSNTWVSHTGRGGKHYWYKLADSEDRYLKSGYASCLPLNGEIVHTPHIDLKCSGGSYVVAPPSVVPQGAYQWIRRGILADAPKWLRGPRPPTVRLARTFGASGVKGSAKRVATICEIVAAASVGHRNNTLNWGAFHIAEVVIAGALQRQQAHNAVLEAAIEAGLSSQEAERTIRSAFVARGI